MRKTRFIITSIYYILSICIILSSVFYIIPALNHKEDLSKEKISVIRLWNIDTFEGGKGSRTSFLRGVSNLFEKKNRHNYIITSSYTIDGINEALKNGDYPDMISFGIGLEMSDSNFLLLEKQEIIGYGKEKMKVVPWCRGVYAIYAKEERFDKITKDNIVLSKGGKNVIEMVLEKSELLVGLKNCRTETSTSAYIHFISGDYKYLIGTQRDACRFLSRGMQVYVKPIKEFSDLYQYIGIITKDKEKQQICKNYIKYLLCTDSQKKLVDIGMMSVNGNIYSSDFPMQSTLEKVNIENTISPFLGMEKITEIKSLIDLGNGEDLKKFLFKP